MNYTLGDTILKAENISLNIGGKQILRDINLEVKDVLRPGVVTGQIIGLLAPSGMGKTQLFKILSGLNQPTTGTVLLGTENKPVKSGDVGVVAQNYPLFEHRTIWSNLEMVCKEKTKKEKTDKINYYLDKFNLFEHKDKFPALLSGGQKQRVAIIQQLLCSEFFILMDEPFSGLDPVMTSQVCDMIKEVANLHEKTTIIVVSHDISSTISISEYIWLLGRDRDKDGNIIPGATLKYNIDLMERGLTWKENLVETNEFLTFVKDVKKIFKEL